MGQLVGFLVNGLTLGAIYALIALSYTMVYGIMKLINFAYSGLFTLDAYAAIWGLGVVGISNGTNAVGLVALGVLLLAVAIAAVAAGVSGVVVERLAYRPLRSAPLLALLISALGVSLVIQNGIEATAGSAPKFLPDVLGGTALRVDNARITVLQIVIIGVSVTLMGGLWLVVNRTSFGLQIRATADRFMTARLMGIRTDRVIALVFFLGSALGGAAGVLYAIYYGTATFTMGYIPSIKAFTAAVLGGIGSIPGAVLGGLLLGVVESLAAGYSGALTNGKVGANYQDVIAFLLLIGVLTMRPTGLLGERVTR